MDDLTPKQAAFVTEYVIDLNATQAAIRAGYSEDSAQMIGSENLSKPIIAKYIKDHLNAKAKRAMITADMVMREYARIAFADVRKTVDAEGSPIPISELDDDTAASIQCFDVVSVGNAVVGEGKVLKVRMNDKIRALDMLAKHLGINGQDNKQPEGMSNSDLLDELSNRLPD